MESIARNLARQVKTLAGVDKVPASSGGLKSSEESAVKGMAQKNDLRKLIGFLTIAACIAAVVDPRFRKLCVSLLCKL